MWLETMTAPTGDRSGFRPVVIMRSVVIMFSGLAVASSLVVSVAFAQVEKDDVVALRRAIVDLTETFGAKYPQGQKQLARLSAIEGKLKQMADTSTGELMAATAAFESLRRDALLDNPL
jgi:hypothetical protein